MAYNRLTQDLWQNACCEIFINPRLPEVQKAKMIGALRPSSLQKYPANLWMTTSGTSGNLKWVALSKEAMLSSAKAVNTLLGATKADIWYHSLPIFHVGGIAIYARAYLSGSRVIVYEKNKWDPAAFVDGVTTSKATLTSVVPTQVYDVVMNQLKAPEALRAVIVGGGSLDPMIYFRAKELGWPLLPSYGMTECASQVATAELSTIDNNVFPVLRPLEHLDIKLNAEGYLMIRGASLLSTYVYVDPPHLYDPKVNGWFTTEDLVTIENGMIKKVGRKGGFVKVGGESVDLARLQHILDNIQLGMKSRIDAAVLPHPDNRLGHAIHLAIDCCDNNELVKTLIETFNAEVLPFERIRDVQQVKSLSRTSLGKICL